MRRYWFLILLSLFFLPGSAQESPPDYKAVDRHARRAPQEISRDLPALTDYLISESKNDFERARAIYVWITHHIRYDEEAFRAGRQRVNRSNSDILRRQQAVCFGYSQLFKAMCTRAGLESAVISGYSKGTLTTTPDMQSPDHAWNAVRLEGQWYLLDATWGAGQIQRGNKFVQTERETYFLSAPEQFVLNHLPVIPMWQLLSSPLDAATFQQPADSITAYLALAQPSFHFEDSISYWRSLPRSKQRLWEARKAYGFHPTRENRHELGHVYMDYAGDLSDTIDRLPHDRSLDTLIGLQARVIKACEQARQYADSLYNWQRELHVNTLINQATALYQRVYEETNEATLQKAYTQMQQLLFRARDIIGELPESSFYARQVGARVEEYLEVIAPYLPDE